jgi:hypothetical protein
MPEENEVYDPRKLALDDLMAQLEDAYDELDLSSVQRLAGEIAALVGDMLAGKGA